MYATCPNLRVEYHFQFMVTGVPGVNGPRVALVVGKGLPTEDEHAQIHDHLSMGTIALMTQLNMPCAL